MIYSKSSASTKNSEGPITTKQCDFLGYSASTSLGHTLPDFLSFSRVSIIRGLANYRPLTKLHDERLHGGKENLLVVSWYYTKPIMNQGWNDNLIGIAMVRIK